MAVLRRALGAMIDRRRRRLIREAIRGCCRVPETLEELWWAEENPRLMVAEEPSQLWRWIQMMPRGQSRWDAGP